MKRSYDLFSDYHNLCCSASCTSFIKIYEIDETKVAKVHFTVIYNDGLASAYYRGDKVCICVVATACIFAVLLREFKSLGTGMKVNVYMSFS